MKILRQDKAIFRVKDGGTKSYFRLFPEYEVDTGILPPGLVEKWHSHKAAQESLLVANGEIEISWVDNGKIKKETLGKGDFAEFDKGPHRIANRSQSDSTIIVFKFVPSGKSTREILKTDKEVHDISE